MRRTSLIVTILGLCALAACSAPANLPELARAEGHERAGEDAEALAAYREAQKTCRQLEPLRRRREICAMALLGEAGILERQGKTAEAIAAYAAIPEKSGGDAPPSAQGLYRAGQLMLETAGDDPAATRAAWTVLWKVVTDYPDEAHAADAVTLLVRDGRGRDARALSAQLSRLVTALATTQVADNLWWALADLAENELTDKAGARAAYDHIPQDHPKSGLRDDARWHAARLSRELGDAKGAVARLKKLLATREVSYIGGSYFSVWLDDGQLELGRILRDDLGDFKGAAAAFRRLGKDYPDSILRDDAAIELADTLARAGDSAGACAELDHLARGWPDSKHLAERAPTLAQKLGCKQRT
jgi:tetratricopeptide (TPR) repeat protein